jgi:AraC-like DNA-binding protein
MAELHADGAGVTAFSQAIAIAVLTAAWRTGDAPPEIAARLGLAVESIADPVRRVPHAQLVRCWTMLADDADDFGLRAARLFAVGGRSLVDYAMMSARDLHGALDTFIRFQRWMHDAADHRLRIDGDEVTLQFGLLRGHRLPAVIWDYLTAMAALRTHALVGGTTPLRVHLPRGEHADVAAAHELFGAPVVYGASAPTVVWPRSALTRPVAARDDSLHHLLARQLEVALGLPSATELRLFAADAGEEVVAAVRRTLATELLRGEAGMTAVARRLGTSPRSLQRRLQAGGTTFQAELDGVRRALAQRLMAEPGASAKAVAFALGFSEMSAFTRAFRRWTGQTPTAYARATG